MFFQFSPPVPSRPREDESNPEDRDEILSLAPFTHNPKLAFADIPVGTTTTRKLVIRNPSKRDIPLSIKHTIPSELNLSMNWTETTVKNSSIVTLELTWTPKTELSSRHMIYVSDGAKINRNIPITFKSVCVKKTKPTGAKPKPKPTKAAAIQTISPKLTTVRKTLVGPPRPASPMTRQLSPTRRYLTPISRTAARKSSPQRHLPPKPIVQIQKPGDDTRRATFVKEEKRRLTYVVKDTPTPRKKAQKETSGSPKVASTPLMTLFERPMSFEEKLQWLQVDSSEEDVADFELTKDPPPIDLSASRSSTNLTYDLPYVLADKFKRLNLSKSESNLYSDFSPSPQTFVGSSTSIETYTLKSQSNVHDDLDQSPQTFAGSSTSMETYTVKSQSNIHDDLNQSPLTFVGSSTSMETYTVKSNSSAETYVVEKDSSVEDLKSVTESLSEHRQLWAISEETSSEISFVSKRKSEVEYIFSPPKRQALVQPIKDWSKSGSSVFRVAKKSSGLKIQKQNGNNTVITTTDSKKVIVQDPFLYANIVDPFLTSDLYASEEWIKEQENNFRKWLNYLLKPPDEFEVSEKFDMDQIWQQCKTQSGVEVQTKEQVAVKYHTSTRWENLRKKAASLYRSPQVSAVLKKVSEAVDAKKLKIRDDKDFHLNLNLQSIVVGLIMSYHPLWLRIGLEIVFNERLTVRSKDDKLALSHFVLERMIKNPAILKKYKSPLNKKYVVELKKFFLKKFLSLVYFLDVAKSQKLIPHDPCLFYVNSDIKDSRSLLINFAKEAIASIGDITKYLKRQKYLVTYEQSYIHEFNYMVTNLGVDLRDGIRLTRLMEIILMKSNLLEQLRTPPISRLQKLHNMKIVFATLEQAGFQISPDISPKDIIDGHREKTLSFLWQIIYKFEAPLMMKHATTIQTWYRSLPVTLKRRKLQKEANKKTVAATTIQKWYRRRKLAKKYTELARIAANHVEEKKKQAAATKIQAFIRMYICRKKYQATKDVIEKLQAACKGYITRKKYNVRVPAAITIQKYVRMYQARKKYNALRNHVISLQKKFRAKLAMKRDREKFLKQKQAAISIQRYYRGYEAMKTERTKFEELKSSVIFVQRHYRGIKQMQQCRLEYLERKTAVLKIQKFFRSTLETRKCQVKFKTVVQAAIKVQRYYRGYKEMRVTKMNYERMKWAAQVIQQRYHAKKLSVAIRNEYESYKKSACVIQIRFRATMLMQRQQQEYLALKKAAIYVQRKYRAKKLAQTQRSAYLKLKNAAVVVQTRYRANKLAQETYSAYSRMKWAAIVIQRRYQANLKMKDEVERYEKVKNATLIIQRWWKATSEMSKQRQSYLTIIKSVCTIQRYYRGYKLMKDDKEAYIKKREAISHLQKYIRGFLLRKRFAEYFSEEAVAARKFEKMKNIAATKIQALWRGYRVRKHKAPKPQAKAKMSAVSATHGQKQKTLGVRCDISVEQLLQTNASLRQITIALENLDFIIRHCQTSRIRMSNILPDVIYLTLNSTARSLPEMTASNLAALILISFYKYPPTRDKAWMPEYIDQLVTVMMHWCDKDAPLFPTLCTLMWLFAHNPEWKKFILRLPNFTQKIEKIKSLVARKQSMAGRSKSKCQFFGPVSQSRIPTTKPTWGLDHNRPNVFLNSVHALHTFLKILGLSIK